LSSPMITLCSGQGRWRKPTLKRQALSLIQRNSFGESMRLVAKLTALLMTPLAVLAMIIVYVWEALEAYDD